MNLTELDHALRKLRLSGMADVLETRLRQAQSEKMAPIDLVSALVSDELLRRQDRLFARRIKLASFRDAERGLDSFDFEFNRKMNRALVYELATARFVGQREDVLLLGPPGTGKSHLAHAIGRAAIRWRSSASCSASNGSSPKLRWTSENKCVVASRSVSSSDSSLGVKLPLPKRSTRRRWRRDYVTRSTNGALWCASSRTGGCRSTTTTRSRRCAGKP
jgi:hypothetical protein